MRCAAAAISPRCSSRIAARRAAVRRRPGRGARLRAATAARGSGSCAATPPASRTPPISRARGCCARPKPRPARPAAVAAGAAHGRARAHGVAPDRRRRRAARDGREAPQGRAARRAPTPRPARAGERDHVGDRVVRRRPPPHPRRELRRPARRRRPGAHADVGAVRRDRRHRHADRLRSARPHDGLRALRRRSRPRTSAARAAQRALTLLDAVPAPSGRLPVVLKRGAGGVLFHEACGHGLEADHILKDASVFKGQMGAAVASPLVTLVDDGGYGREWGTLAIDDEGHAAQRNVLIENGVLTDYMWDVVRARKEGRAPSGNGRRETLPPPADAAHDEHVPARRRRPIPTTSSAASTSASTACSSAAARSTPPPATSCSASPRRTSSRRARSPSRSAPRS